MIHSLSTESISVETSRYRRLAGPAARHPGVEEPTLVHSLQKTGLQLPLLVHEFPPKSFHLIDGFRRMRAISTLGWSDAPCSVLAAGKSPEEVLGVVLAARKRELDGSMAAKARFVGLCREFRIPADTCCREILPSLELEGHNEVLRRLLRVSELPAGVLDFGEEKRFSLKQLSELARHPPELLELVFSWRDRLVLTASVLEEVLGHLSAHLRASGTSPREVSRMPGVEEVLNSQGNPNEKTRQLRDLLRRLRFPVLTETNRKLGEIRSALGLPAGVEISWDATLEEHAVRISITVRRPEEWRDVVGKLGSEKVERSISNMLDLL